jgi:hypothetical protein
MSPVSMPASMRIVVIPVLVSLRAMALYRCRTTILGQQEARELIQPSLGMPRSAPE